MALGKDQELVWAAGRGDLQRVVEYAQFWGDPKFNDSEALKVAARNGHADVVEYLIPLSNPNAEFGQALTIAAAWGYTECVSLLVNATDLAAKIRSKDRNVGEQALYLAAERGHFDVVQILVNACVVPTSDHFINAVYGGNLDCVVFLFSFINNDMEHLNSALYVAASLGQTPVVDYLFDQIDDVGVQEVLNTLKHDNVRDEYYIRLHDKLWARRQNFLLQAIIEDIRHNHPQETGEFGKHKM